MKTMAQQELSIKDHTDVDPLMLPISEDVLTWSTQNGWTAAQVSDL